MVKNKIWTTFKNVKNHRDIIQIINSQQRFYE